MLDKSLPRYTQARLEHALRVFHESEPYRSKRGLKAENLEQLLKGYNLRTPTHISVVPRHGLWLDKDDSGDYAPTSTPTKKRNSDNMIPPPHTPKRKASTALLGKNKKAKNTWLSGRQRGESKIVVFKLTIDAGRALLRRFREVAGEAGELDEDNANCGLAQDEPGLWAKSGGSFSVAPRECISSLARKQSVFGPDKNVDEDEENLTCRLGLRTSTAPNPIPRKKAACGQCRAVKKRCVHVKNKGIPCKRCGEEGLQCDFAIPGETKNKSQEKKSSEKKNLETCDAEGHLDHRTLVRSQEVEVCSALKTITTTWAHPIDFKVPLTANPGMRCHFCNDYRYGIFGCGIRTVEVIAKPNSVSYEETGGGHRAEGKDATRMCIRCAFARLAVSICPGHEMRPVSSLHEANIDHRQVWKDLLDSNIATRKRQPDIPVCHFCVLPVSRVCGARQTFTRLGARIPEGGEHLFGCGLMLCAWCAEVLKQEGMDKEKLEMRIMQRRYPVRADMEFLFSGSDLHQAYRTCAA